MARLVAWPLTRMAVFPFMFYTLAVARNQSVWQAVGNLTVYCKVGSLLLALPQIYWFATMVRLAVRPRKLQTEMEKRSR